MLCFVLQLVQLYTVVIDGTLHTSAILQPTHVGIFIFSVLESGRDDNSVRNE
jgi:hypothetical protein